MARPRLAPRRQLKVYVPEELYTELVLLDSSMIDSSGALKYGAISSLIARLMRAHIEGLKAEIKSALNGRATEVSS